MNTSATPETTTTSRGRDAALAVRELLERLDGELHHPQLAGPLSGLAVRGIALATGWSLGTWRAKVEQWCAAMQQPDTAALDPGAAEWVKRLGKLREFLATAAREAAHLDAGTDPEAQALFGAAGQGTVDTAVRWFAALKTQTTDTEATAVTVCGLTKRYGQVTAVDAVSLTILQGQTFGLLGPNSAGKTTLIECIEGIRTPDTGTVHVLGLDHQHHAKQIKTRIGVQLQKTGFYELLSLRETLELYASFYPRPVDVPDLMTRLQIHDKAKTLVKDMSGGILQRMSLGVALVNDPELVFLDEPTTGLDPQARRAIWDVVRSLRERGRTVILTTHYMDEAEQLCDRVAIIVAGGIRAQGAPADLIRQHVGDSVVDIALTEGFDPATIPALPGIRRCIAQGGRLLIQSDDPVGLLSALLSLPQPPADARIRRGTLEDVFLTIAEQGKQS